MYTFICVYAADFAETRDLLQHVSSVSSILNV